MSGNHYHPPREQALSSLCSWRLPVCIPERRFGKVDRLQLKDTRRASWLEDIPMDSLFLGCQGTATSFSVGLISHVQKKPCSNVARLSKIVSMSAGTKPEFSAAAWDDQKGLNVREEDRWQREQRRWERERDRHQREGRKREARKERLEVELAVLQGRLAERKATGAESRTRGVESTGIRGGRKRFLEAGRVSVDPKGSRKEESTPGSEREAVDFEVPTFLNLGDSKLGTQNKGRLSVEGLREPESSNEWAAFGQPQQDGDWEDGSLNSMFISQNDGVAGEIIEVVNLNSDIIRNVQTPTTQHPSATIASSMESSKVGVREQLASDGQPQAPLKKQKELLHFNEHAYVHNYLRQHHMRWWMRTHRGDKTDPLSESSALDGGDRIGRIGGDSASST